MIEYSKENPSVKQVKARIKELEERLDKIKKGTLTPYDINKIQKEQKEFFEKLRKKEKAYLSEELSNNIWLKIEFLKKIGALDNYEEDYNRTLERLFMPSSFRVKDKDKFEKEFLDKDALKKLSISDLIALNAFWTNRLVKEVERRNEVIYVIENTNNFYHFSNGEKLNLIDEDIMYYLAEYRAIVHYITKYKNYGRSKGKEVTVDEHSNLAALEFDIRQIFSSDDIDYYGFSELNQMANNVLLLNNRSQLLYDQKDIAIEEMISLLVNTKELFNAGISFEDDPNRNTSKSLMVVDLKGFNAPLMLHINKENLESRLKKVSGNTRISIYRGQTDLINYSAQNGREIAKTNLLFKLNSEQRKDIIARSGIVGPRDTNGRYVTHISWMLNPKKEMPKLIYEPKRIIDLQTGEIEEIKEENERKK